MVLGIAEIVILGLLIDWLVTKIKLPGLLGLLALGVVLGPFATNLMQKDLQLVSADWRLFALVVILLRAGFEMSRKTLERVGFRAFLMAFIPCLCEVGLVTLVAPMLLPLNRMEAAMLGSVLAAVSPAVVVPLMIQFQKEGRGAEKGVPTLVMAGSSVDDAVAIVLCTSFIGMYSGKAISLVKNLLSIPASVLTGITAGLIIGVILYKLFIKFNPRATKRCLIILGVSILLITAQKHIEEIFPFAALIAIMAIGFIILEKNEHVAHEISSKLGKIWVFAQLLLFTLVGAQVNVPVALEAGLMGAVIVLVGLLGRSIGVQLCLLKSEFNTKERIFVAVSYLPKATVQAAIGGLPLAAMKAAGMGTRPGEIILALGVLSIIMTAPVGAILINWAGHKFLEVEAQKARPSEAMIAATESE
jgi:NhaP-type Na+/H+ or K+/H+ antiporter